MKLPALRFTYFTGLIAITLVLAFTAFIQTYKGLIPCPLCILQRVALMILGVLFFFGAILKLKNPAHYVISVLSLLIATGGWTLAARQVWLQYSPEAQAGDCSVGLNYMIQTFPFTEVLKKIFQSNVDCAKVDWDLLGLSLAGWSLIFFSTLVLMTLWECYRSYFKRQH
ncbi:MAG: disulfide bond formation protein B [Pseudomonadota bacterium]